MLERKQAKQVKQSRSGNCAHCGGRVQTRTSKELHIHLRTVYLQCQGCGWKGVGELHIKHDLARPCVYNREALLPLAPAAIFRESLKDAVA